MKKKYGETNWIEVPVNKYEGQYKGMTVYSNPTVPDDVIYKINEDDFLYTKLRKDGKPDMRFKWNKLFFKYYETTEEEKNK